MPTILHVLNGPNLDLLGTREPEIYGSETLDDIKRRCETRAAALGVSVVFRQSNSEGALVDWLHEARNDAAGVIINAGAYSHTSIAILDALQAIAAPIVEVHVSNIMRREPFRRRSYVSLAARGLICGLGGQGYELAIEALATIIKASSRGEK